MYCLVACLYHSGVHSLYSAFVQCHVQCALSVTLSVMLCAPSRALAAVASPAVRRRRRLAPPLRGAVCVPAEGGVCLARLRVIRRGWVWACRRTPLASWRGSLGSRCPAGAPGACGGSTCRAGPTYDRFVVVCSVQCIVTTWHTASALTLLAPVRLQWSSDCINLGLLRLAISLRSVL